MISVLPLTYSNSTMITTTLICAVVGIVFAMVVRGLRRRLLLPPGPWFLQLRMFYYMLRMTMPCRVEKLYEEQSRRYGKIFSYGLGSDVQVVLSDVDIIREAFVGQRAALSDRRCPSAYVKSFGGEHTHRIVFANGRLWRTARRVVSPCLNNIGAWGEQMETIILQEADHLMDELASFESKPFDPRRHITSAVASIIHTMVHGYNLEYDDPRLQQMIDSFQLVAVHPLITSDTLRYLPFLYYLPRLRPLRRAFMLLKTMLTTAVNSQADGYKNSINTIVKRILQAAEEDEGIGEDRLKTGEIWRLVYDLMLAGSDTTANTLKWAVLAMAYYPQVQKKVHEEINCVLGDRSPCLQDKKSLPYIQATINEVLRVRPVLPLALPHVASETTVLRGYTIPKGAILVANVWSCHNNPEYWDAPEVFNPNRFLSEDGQSLRTNSAFMPFSVGPRRCMGDRLATNELFLIFTKMVQRFDIDFAPGDRPSSFDEGGKGLILRPNEMKVRLLPRPTKLQDHEE